MWGVSRGRIYTEFGLRTYIDSVPAQTGGSAKPKSVPDLPISKLSTMPLAASTGLVQADGIGNYATNNTKIRDPGSSTQVLT